MNPLGASPLCDDSRLFEKWRRNACAEEIQDADRLIFWREFNENFIRISEEQIDEALACISAHPPSRPCDPQIPDEKGDFIRFGDSDELSSALELMGGLFSASPQETKPIFSKMVQARKAEQQHRFRMNGFRRRREARWSVLKIELERLFDKVTESVESLRSNRAAGDSSDFGGSVDLARRLAQMPSIFRKPAFMILMFVPVREFGRTAYELADKGWKRHLDVPMGLPLNKSKGVIFGLSWADTGKKIHRIIPSSPKKLNEFSTLLDCSWHEVEALAIEGDKVAGSVRTLIDNAEINPERITDWVQKKLEVGLSMHTDFWAPESSIRGGVIYDSVRLARACFGRKRRAPDFHVLMTEENPEKAWKFGSPIPNSCSEISKILRKVKQIDGAAVPDTTFTNTETAVNRYLDLLKKTRIP
jgi:hypothetical protein